MLLLPASKDHSLCKFELLHCFHRIVRNLCFAPSAIMKLTATKSAVSNQIKTWNAHKSKKSKTAILICKSETVE